jgi:hypothetical protein
MRRAEPRRMLWGRMGPLLSPYPPSPWPCSSACIGREAPFQIAAKVLLFQMVTADFHLRSPCKLPVLTGQGCGMT